MSRIAFRVDASSKIGTGHFMRCLTLAIALRKCGAQIRFISRYLPDYLRSMLAREMCEFVLLNSQQNNHKIDGLVHSHWLGVSQEQDAADSLQALSDQIWDWLVVDHYALDSHWELMFRNVSKKILVIDDIADRKHECDMLLDQNFYCDMQHRYTDKIPAGCQLLMGPRYALLRDEFRQLRKELEPRNGPVKRILIFFGGVDEHNYTGLAVSVLSEIGVDELHIDVVIGLQHPNCEEIKALCRELGFFLHVQTNKMAELIASADLVIGAGGATTWERCCLGAPALSICVAKNQVSQIRDAAHEGLLYGPEVGSDVALAIKTHIMALLDNSALRSLISRKAWNAVDGRGVMRVVGNLQVSEIEMRVAEQSDSAKLFEWRNHPRIRSVSKNQELISWQNHQKWFTSVLSSSDRILLIGCTNAVSIGVVRFDLEKEYAEISIYLVPDTKNSGQGRGLLSTAEQWLKKNRPEIKFVRANVLAGNELSREMFLDAGYQLDTTLYLKKI